MSAWLELLPIPDAVRLSGEPPEGHLFFDTSSLAMGDKCTRVIRDQGGGLVSAIVLGEWLARSPNQKHLKNTIEFFQDHKLLVVCIDADVIETYWRLTRGLRFDASPILKPGENSRESRRRLAADLMIFATSLCYRRTLVTNNKHDFDNFGHPEAWKTLEAVAGS